MRPSERILAFIKGFEKLRLRAFRPTPNDVPTIGWGHTEGVKMGTVWTREQADSAFAADVARFAEGLNRALFGIPTTQGQFDALLSFAYNEGLGAPTLHGKGLLGSTLFHKHKIGDHAGAAAEFPKWDRQAGHVLPGLLRRRTAERAIYLS